MDKSRMNGSTLEILLKTYQKNLIMQFLNDIKYDKS